MAASVIVDAGFLVALLSGHDVNHGWAAAQAARSPPPWATCEASVTEAFRLLGPAGGRGLRALLERRAATCTFPAGKEIAPLLKLMAKYEHELRGRLPGADDRDHGRPGRAHDRHRTSQLPSARPQDRAVLTPGQTAEASYRRGSRLVARATRRARPTSTTSCRTSRASFGIEDQKSRMAAARGPRPFA